MHPSEPRREPSAATAEFVVPEPGFSGLIGVARRGEHARRARPLGFNGVHDNALPVGKQRPVRAAAANLEAAGEGVDVMVDSHARPSPRMGAPVRQGLEPCGLSFLEELC